MTTLGSQCSPCSDPAWVQTNQVVGNIPAAAPATPTASNNTVFPQVVVDCYDNGAIFYTNNTGSSWEICNISLSSVTYIDDTGTSYDIVTDPGSGNGGASNRPVTPVAGDEVIELYDNGILMEIYDGAQWVSNFFSSCCPADTQALTNATLVPAPADAESPTDAEIQVYYDSLASTDQGPGTQITYTSPNGDYWTWIVDPSGTVIPHERPGGLTGHSNQGTFISIAAVAADLPPLKKVTYYYDMNTAAGDIDMSALAAITGVSDGAYVVFRNTGENNLLFDQLINGVNITHTAQGVGSSFRLSFDSTQTPNYELG